MKKHFIALAALAVLILLILHAPRVSHAANEAVSLCLHSLVPSLFPILFITGVFIERSMDTGAPVLRSIGRFCGIPEGAETILMAGLLGGYPIGAQAISNAYGKEQISRKDARHMLRFCSNAGPSFIFGIGMQLFSNGWILASLWGLQIFSSIVIGHLLAADTAPILIPKQQKRSLSEILSSSLKTMGMICGWVILFRILLDLLDFFPISAHPLFTGALELTNGFFALSTVTNAGTRYIYAAILLSLGGGCVLLQTASVAKEIGIKSYIEGKLLQTIMVFFISYIVQFFLFHGSDRSEISPLFMLPTALGVILWYCSKKKCLAFPEIMMYNKQKESQTE